MKLKINGKEQEIEFWSFLKCTFLAQIVIEGVTFAVGFILAAISIGA